MINNKLVFVFEHASSHTAFTAKVATHIDVQEELEVSRCRRRLPHICNAVFALRQSLNGRSELFDGFALEVQDGSESARFERVSLSIVIVEELARLILDDSDDHFFGGGGGPIKKNR